MMKLFGNKQSACTRSVLMTLVEKGKTVEFINLELGKGEHKSEEYLSINPFGKIPLLEVDSGQIYESQAICRYLDDSLPGFKLMPSDPLQAAKVNQWMSISLCYFTPNAYDIVLNKIFMPMMGGTSDENVVAKAETELKVVYQAMNEQLTKNKFLAGENFTLCDIAFVQYTDFLLQAKCEHIVFEHEEVRRWWHLVCQRDSYKNPLAAII